MQSHDAMTARFEENRTHLGAVAYRILGSASEADDAVQETWLRFNRSDTSDVENLGGWLTTVLSRICLDMLRSRSSRREEAMGGHDAEPVGVSASVTDPEHEALLTDSVGEAMLVVLETLTPAERLAFVLHDTFGVPYDEIAPIVDRSPVATRQLASRARRRVQGATSARETDLDRRREVVDAFLAASRNGEFQSLVALLDPDAMVRADAAAVALGGDWRAHGATAVAKTFSGRARAARPALIDGAPGAVWAPGGKPKVAIEFSIVDGTIVGIDLLADPALLEQLTIEILEP
ncbi:MAG TPA: sigma-70 family RNA polymerase sigma factor [Thermomicrobiales bacterium]|nr:sigma-70 family RNA polymerase sigma factor [Thermomicrobiales bacterium]